MTVLDPRDLQRLTEETESPEAVYEFVLRYRRILPQRVHRIVEALTRGDLDGAMDATLSLKASSSIVGAGEAGELATRIQAALREQDLPAARAAASLLTRASIRLNDQLGAFLGDAEPEATSSAPSDSRPPEPSG